MPPGLRLLITRQQHLDGGITRQRETAYQALAGQAEIELAFHTPGNGQQLERTLVGY